LLLEAISKINNPQLKAGMLHKLRKMLNKKESNDTKIPKPTISLSETLKRFNKLKSKKVNLEYLQNEVSQIKKEIQQLKSENDKLQDRVSVLELEEDDKLESSNKKLIKSNDEIRYCNLLNKIILVKWHTNVKIIIENYEIEVIVLIDTGADLNCIQEGLIPTKYFEKSIERLNSANGSKMKIKYEVNNAHVCKDKVSFKTSFVLVKNLNDKVILGLPFIHLLYPFTTEEDGIMTAPFG
jgi:hypothetical protein